MTCSGRSEPIVSAPILADAPLPKPGDLAPEQASRSAESDHYFDPRVSGKNSGRSYFLTYTEPSGETATVDRVDDVPIAVRGLVRIDMPHMPPPKGRVWLTDISTPPSELGQVPGYKLRRVSEAEWYDMAKTLSSQLVARDRSQTPSPAQKPTAEPAIPATPTRATVSPVKRPKTKAAAKRSRQRRTAASKQQKTTKNSSATLDVNLTRLAADGLSDTDDRNASSTISGPTDPAAYSVKPISVVVYGTSWCPACRAARSYFSQSGIRYRNFDVDSDQAAAAKMAAIQRSNGYPVGSIPLIVIGGRAYQGFSKLSMASIIARVKASQS